MRAFFLLVIALNNYWRLFLLLVATGGIYCLGISGPLVLDDGANLEPILRVRNHLVPWYSIILTNPSSSVGRPVSLVSFFLNYWVFGFNVIAFKAANIVLHLGIGLVLYNFVRKLLQDTVYSRVRARVALTVVACWLISPLFVSTVLYVVQRMAMLSTLFTLLALSEYLTLRRGLAQERVNWGSLSLFCLYALLGVFSKENAVLLPLFLMVIELYFCAPIKSERGRQLWCWLATLSILIPLIATPVLVLYKSNIFFDYSSRTFTLVERVLTESRVVWSYVRALLIPQSSLFGLFHDDIQLSNGLFLPIATLISLFAWAAVLVVVVISLRFQCWRPVGGAVGLFLVGHILESTVFPLEIYFEHRNYLPGMGAYLALILIGEYLIARKVVSFKIAKAAIYGYILVFFVALSQRVLIWSNYESMVFSSYQSHPNSPRAIIEAASLDAQYGRFDDALNKLNYVKEKKMAPLLGANLQIIWTYCVLNRDGIEQEIERLINNPIIDGSPYTSIAMQQLNDLISVRPCKNVPYEKAVFLLASRLEEYYRSVYFSRLTGTQRREVRALRTRTLEALNLTGQTQKTIELYDALNSAGDGNFDSDLLVSVALIDVGRLDEARALIDKLRLDTSMAARVEAGHLASVEEMYRVRRGHLKANDNG